MCGIHLIIDKKQVLNTDAIRKMVSISHHRGPDEHKIRQIDSTSITYFLGSNRLKITDQSDFASQPFLSPDSRQALMFNGEIYNFHTLKNQLLDREIIFQSNSDTEVLFHWLQIFGKAGIKKLEGMFAFVFVDLENDEILIARDRFGIKSLYYVEDENYFIASSEIKSILGTGLVKKELNESQIQHYLLYKYANSPNTLFKNIYELTHGSVFQFKNNTWKLDSFNSNSSSTHISNPDINKIETLLTNSLLQQIDAPVPLGLLLSGGVDSTLLLALAQKEGFTLPTFSIINSKAEKSFGTKDYYYSKMAASIYSSEHHEVEMNSSILDDFDGFIQNLDQPIGDSSYLLTSEICKYASGSMKVLLSGAGADEYFAGYNRHWAFYKYLQNQKSIDLLAPLAKSAISIMPIGRPHPFRKKFALLKKWAIAYDVQPETTFRNFLKFNELNLNPGFLDKNKESNGQDLLHWALQHDQNNYLVNDVLALSDKASMQHGVELRVPYLDENLVNYLSSLPSSALLKNGRKWILKEILKNNGGQKFVHRPKEGFGLPLSSWLFDKKAAHLWELFQSEESLIFNFLDKKLVDKLISSQRRKSEDHGPLLWSILVLGHWLEHNFQ